MWDKGCIVGNKSGRKGFLCCPGDDYKKLSNVYIVVVKKILND
jgi:hypothetical protein